MKQSDLGLRHDATPIQELLPQLWISTTNAPRKQVEIMPRPAAEVTNDEGALDSEPCLDRRLSLVSGGLVV